MNAPQRIRRSVSSKELDSFSLTSAAPDFLKEWFINWLVEYIDGGASIRDEQTLDCGFVTLKCQVRDRHLTLLAPDFHSMPIQWKEDLTHALGTLSAHKYVPQSLGMEPHMPTLMQTAIIGAKFNEHPFFMHHCESCSDVNPNDSGWFIGHNGPTVDNNDPASLKLMSLYEVVLKAPDILVFLSLPIGCIVLFTGDRPVLAKDDEELEIPPDSYLDQLLSKHWPTGKSGSA